MTELNKHFLCNNNDTHNDIKFHNNNNIEKLFLVQFVAKNKRMSVRKEEALLSLYKIQHHFTWLRLSVK